MAAHGCGCTGYVPVAVHGCGCLWLWLLVVGDVRGWSKACTRLNTGKPGRVVAQNTAQFSFPEMFFIYPITTYVQVYLKDIGHEASLRKSMEFLREATEYFQKKTMEC